MSYYLLSLGGWGGSRIQGKCLEGRGRANRGFRGGGRRDGRTDEGWLELSVCCLSSSIQAALRDSLPTRTACKPG